jgi:RNA-binding protein YlmH
MSRGKMGDLIDGGDVSVNWRQVQKKDAEVTTGDMLSVRGKGRVQVVSAEETKKGRFQVKMIRFL